MHPAVEARLNGIRDILMAHHVAGKSLPSATKGGDREILVREFLAKVLPPPFRFGSGEIVDCQGNSSGQVDVVVEFPFLPSFPTPGSPERLYLAESVAFVIEVKSNLKAQWATVLRKSAKISKLQRTWSGHLQFASDGTMKSRGASQTRIPFIAIGFEGYASCDGLANAMNRVSDDERPRVAAVIKSGAYVSRVRGSTPKAEGVDGLFALCADAAYFARNVMVAHPDLKGYRSRADV